MQISALRNTRTSHTRAPTAPRLTVQTENTTSITSPTQTYFKTPMLKHYLQQRPPHNKHPTEPHTLTTTDIQSSMSHIHTSIVSRHLATIGNNKILRTPPPLIMRSEDIFPPSLFAPLPNSEQINHPLLNYTYTTSTPNHIHHHYALFVTLSHTQHTYSLQRHHMYTMLSPLDVWTYLAGVTTLLDRWTEKLVGGPQQ